MSEETSEEEGDTNLFQKDSNIRRLGQRDRMFGRREFCESEGESDDSDELQVVSRQHRKKVKRLKILEEIEKSNQPHFSQITNLTDLA